MLTLSDDRILGDLFLDPSDEFFDGGGLANVDTEVVFLNSTSQHKSISYPLA